MTQILYLIKIGKNFIELEEFSVSPNTLSSTYFLTERRPIYRS